jgi:cell division protein FtsL
MARLNALLLALLLGCALLLVTSEHRAKKLFIELQRAQSQARQLDVEWSRLLLEQTQYAKHSLIDPVARRDLKLRSMTADRTLFLGQEAKRQEAKGQER